MFWHWTYQHRNPISCAWRPCQRKVNLHGHQRPSWFPAKRHERISSKKHSPHACAARAGLIYRIAAGRCHSYLPETYICLPLKIGRDPLRKLRLLPSICSGKLLPVVSGTISLNSHPGDVSPFFCRSGPIGEASKKMAKPRPVIQPWRNLYAGNMLTTQPWTSSHTSSSSVALDGMVLGVQSYQTSVWPGCLGARSMWSFNKKTSAILGGFLLY